MYHLKFSYFIGALFFFALILPIQKAEAEDILFSQTGDSSTQTRNGPGDAGLYQELGNNLSGEITAVAVEMSGTGTSTGMTVFRCNDSAYSVGCVAVAADSTSTFTLTGTKTIYKFYFDSGVNLDPTKYYYFRVSSPGNGQSFVYYGNSDATSWPTGRCSVALGAACSFGDLFFVMYGNNQPRTGTFSISMQYPQNLLETPDFQNWVVRWQGAPTTASSGRLCVSYWKIATSTLGPDCAVYFNGTSPTTFPITKSNLLNPIVNISVTSTWYAFPYFVDVNDNTIPGPAISFTINPNTTSTPSLPETVIALAQPGLPTGNNPLFQNSSSSLQNCSITSLGGCLINAGVWLINFLFVPSNNSTQGISNALTGFQEVFPFSVPLTLINELENQSSTSPTSTSLAITVPGVNNINVTFLTSSSMENVVGTSAKNSVFNGIRTILYLATGAIMFSAIW